MKIKKRGNGYTALVWVGEDPETGKSRVKRVSGKTELEVRAKASELQAKYHRSQVSGLAMVDPGSLTVSEYLDLWLAAPGRKYRPNAMSAHRSAARAWKLSPISSVPLGRLTGHDIELVRVEWEQQGLAPRTINQRLTTLRRAFDKAVQWRKLEFNPALSVDPTHRRRPNLPIWTGEETRHFLDYTAEEDELRGPLYSLAALTGMRQGELIALRWSDVNLTTGRIRIERSVESDIGGVVTLGATKTESSRRTIRLGQQAIKTLQEQADRQRFRLRAFGAEPDESTPVFDDGWGQHMKGRTLRKAFARSIRRAGVTPIPFHCVRHVAATQMLIGGISAKLVAQTLGHSSVATTLDYYAHVIEEQEAEGAAALDRAYGFA